MATPSPTVTLIGGQVKPKSKVNSKVEGEQAHVLVPIVGGSPSHTGLLPVGDMLGAADGEYDGAAVGEEDADGASDESADGDEDGEMLGEADGTAEGASDGAADSDEDGETLREADGAADGADGNEDGETLREADGAADGASDGAALGEGAGIMDVGSSLGKDEGIALGCCILTSRNVQR